MAEACKWFPEEAPFDGPPRTVVNLGGEGAAEICTSWEEDGYEVFTCTGPGRGHSCPLIDNGACPVADRAHVIVNGRDPTDPGVEALLTALAERHPDLPVIGST